MSKTVKVLCKKKHKKRAQCSKKGKIGEVFGDSEDQVYWCETPMPDYCATIWMVHELAHTCGWRDGDVGKVPITPPSCPGNG